MLDRLSELSGRTYDVAIVGGGINGASAAQHLAAAGYSVLLVDKGDFGAGSSSRSSRLLHCGLRYLAPGRSIFDFVLHPSKFANALRMAKQGMEARSEFVRTSAERTRAMRFCFPIFEGGPYRNWQVDLAFALLRGLGPKDLPLDYRRISPREAAGMPLVCGLRDFDQLQSVATFREYQLDWPERICLDSVLDAERLGADVRNYTVGRIVSRHTESWTVEVLSNANPGEAVQPVQVTARVVLNMTGIWIDTVSQTAQPQARQRVLGTKGCHILVKLPPECADIGVATLNSKQEPFYCIPWRGYHYFGPTETLYEGDKEHIVVTAEECAWLIAEANRLFPKIGLTERDVLMSWAGVRPLTYDASVPLGNRARVIHDLSSDGLPNIFAMTAGPVMSHRSAARELVAVVARRLKPSHEPRQPNYVPNKYPDNQNSPSLLGDYAHVKISDLRQAVRKEYAQSLGDTLFRRVGLGWECALTPAELERAAGAIGDELGWDAVRQAQEIEKFRRETSFLFNPRERLRPLSPMFSDQNRGG